MEQRVSLVTLGVSDLTRARSFYEALGWTTGAGPGDDVVFFQAGGMIVALWDRAELAKDSVVRDGGGHRGDGSVGGSVAQRNLRAQLPELTGIRRTTGAPDRRSVGADGGGVYRYVAHGANSGQCIGERVRRDSDDDRADGHRALRSDDQH